MIQVSMVGSRLDGARDPLGPVNAYLAELKRGGRVDAWMTRAAAFAQTDIAPAMLDRLVAMDGVFQTRFTHSLGVAMAAHGVIHDGTLNEALSIMGQERVHCIGVMVGIDLVTTELCRKAGIAARPLMMNAIATAGAAAHVAERANSGRPAVARIAGLYMKIGVPLLAGLHGAKYLAAWQSLAGGSSSIAEAERVIFGYSHEVVGAATTQFWPLPPAIIDGMNPNRREIRALGGVPFCVAAGSIIAHQMGLDCGAANTPPELPMDALERAGINGAGLAALAEEISADISLAEKMLDA